MANRYRTEARFSATTFPHRRETSSQMTLFRLDLKASAHQVSSGFSCPPLEAQVRWAFKGSSCVSAVNTIVSPLTLSSALLGEEENPGSFYSVTCRCDFPQREKRDISISGWQRQLQLDGNNKDVRCFPFAQTERASNVYTANLKLF